MSQSNFGNFASLMAVREGPVRLFFVLLSCCAVISSASSLGADEIEATYTGPTTRYFDWNVELSTFSANCATNQMIMVNGQFPGPTIYAVEGDRIIVNVTNNADTDLTIHWHGVLQNQSCWQDGVAYITQCPLKKGDFFVYNFTVTDQRGTAFWHAHITWLRATVHGAIVIFPKDFTYPHPKPEEEFTVVLGEWFNLGADLVEAIGLAGGRGFPLADALLINGKPGSLYNCSDVEGVTTFKVQAGKTYLLRVINAALNTEEFLAIANHKQTVVEVDGEYVKPVEFDSTLISPGQTMNVLITADQTPGTYYMEAKGYTSIIVTDPASIPPGALPIFLKDVPEIPTSAIFQYDKAPVLDPKTTFYPDLPAENDTAHAMSFQDQLFTLHPEKVPGAATKYQFFTIGTASLTNFCYSANNCTYIAAGALNNKTFVNPKIDILQAYYFGTQGVYTTDFPDFPLQPFDYSAPDGPDQSGQVADPGTRVSVLEYGTVVDLVVQGTNYFAFESHPLHLHGHHFWVLGRGMGNYDPNTSPSTLNYYNPASRITVDVPARGWVALRFHATNPGVWFFHCHLEKHASWGMQMAYLVKNGVGPEQTLLPPPARLTACPA